MAKKSENDPILDILNEADKVAKLNAISLSNEDRLHCGLICVDVVLGGGIAPGWYTFFGPEQSAKTTLAITTMASTIPQKVPIAALWDAENSSGSSTEYIENIFKTLGIKANVETIFGVRKDGKWAERPLVYYQDDPRGDAFFNWLHALEKRLPDKRYDSGQWWLVYDKTQDNMAKYGSQMNKKQSQMNGGIWIPAEDSSLQAIILCDSYPAMVPSQQDQDEGTDAMAVQARMFSKHIPRVKGYLRSKRVAVIGINQLRLNPGARFSSPEYEPGGQALAFFSDARIRMFPRSLSGVPFNPKGAKDGTKTDSRFEEEPSVEGDGVDTYRYVHIKAIKNKLSLPNRESWLRVWVSDAEGNARGFDPVWDTFYALYQTGQLTGKRSQIRLNIKGLGEAKRVLSWLDFKTLILGSKEQQIPIFKAIGYRPINLRKGLLNQVRKGVAEELYVEFHKEQKAVKKSKADQDDD